MSLNIVFVTATSVEAEPLRRITGLDVSGKYVHPGGSELDLIVTGIGPVATAWALTKWFSEHPSPDLAINAGIAGSFLDEIGPGNVVMPVNDCFADAGVETENGFMSLFEAGLESKDKFPFTGGKIICGNRFADITSALIRPVNAISVITATGSESTKRKLAAKYNPGIETMEGASFFYICSQEKVPFISIRSVSNMVGPRDRSKWKIPLALENLTLSLDKILAELE